MPPVLLDQKVNRMIQADNGHTAFQPAEITLTSCVYESCLDTVFNVGDKQHPMSDELLVNFGGFSDKWDELFEHLKSIHFFESILGSI